MKDPCPPRCFLYLRETTSWKCEEGEENVHLLTHTTASGMGKNSELIFSDIYVLHNGDNTMETGLQTTGLHTTELQTTGLQTTGPHTTGLQTTGPHTTGLQTTGLQTTGLQTTGLHTIGLQTTGLQTTGLQTTEQIFVQPKRCAGKTVVLVPTEPTHIPLQVLLYIW